jgi:ElaB/YqjD/DUF883 family membrane-anchored ribosome-binding protein
MANHIADQASELGKRATAGVEEAASVARATADTLGEARDHAWDVAQRAGALARDTAAEAYRRGERAGRDIAERVEERPLAALLMAGAIGYAIAYLLHARR